MIARNITNRRIESFHIHEYACSIGIEGGYVLQCEALLRYVGEDGTFITIQDHQEWFGLSKRFNAEAEIANRISGKMIDSVDVNLHSNDIKLRLDNSSIEVLCSSRGYENWQLSGPNGLFIIGYGGRAAQQ